MVDNTLRLLDLLDRHDTKATFFVLGWTAAQFPHLVREIHERGHELGAHSFWHRLVYRQTPDEFRTDLRDSISAIQAASGVTVTCYRAPSFSITKKSQWALEILVEEGMTVDSSIYPIYHDRYGMPDSQPGIHYRATSAGHLLEFPPAVLKTPIGNIPVSGGGYFRLYPSGFTTSCIRRINRSGQPLCSTSTLGSSTPTNPASPPAPLKNLAPPRQLEIHPHQTRRPPQRFPFTTLTDSLHLTSTSNPLFTDN